MSKKKQTRYSGIGGQAVLEGVMMKNKDKYAVAVRKPNGEIDVEVEEYKGIAGESRIARLPFIRGVFSFIDSLVLGMKVTMHSASFYEEEEEEPEEELTVENLNAISLQTAKDYGYFEEGAEDYYAMSWIDITHFFEQPWYVISYCVSNDAAFQIYQAELAEAGAGLALYEAILPRESDGFLDTIEEQGGMESPFATGRMESTAALIREALD